jgi:drug/metabolite transporter (DMT)-like permease
LPLPRTLADGLGLLGGFTFALNNVMLRREAARPEEGRALAMFIGGALIAGALASGLAAQGTTVAWPPPVSAAWVGLAGSLGVLFLFGNLALQYGAGAPAGESDRGRDADRSVRSPRPSAVALGGEVLTWPLVLGGVLIGCAAALSSPAPAAALPQSRRRNERDPAPEAPRPTALPCRVTFDR